MNDRRNRVHGHRHSITDLQRISDLYPELKNGAPAGRIYEELRKRTSGSMARVLAEPIPEDLK